MAHCFYFWRNKQYLIYKHSPLKLHRSFSDHLLLPCWCPSDCLTSGLLPGLNHAIMSQRGVTCLLLVSLFCSSTFFTFLPLGCLEQINLHWLDSLFMKQNRPNLCLKCENRYLFCLYLLYSKQTHAHFWKDWFGMIGSINCGMCLGCESFAAQVVKTQIGKLTFRTKQNPSIAPINNNIIITPAHEDFLLSLTYFPILSVSVC